MCNFFQIIVNFESDIIQKSTEFLDLYQDILSMIFSSLEIIFSFTAMIFFIAKFCLNALEYGKVYHSIPVEGGYIVASYGDYD